MFNGLYVLGEGNFEKIYGSEEQYDIEKMVNIFAPLQTAETVKENPNILKDADIIFSGWGAPILDDEFLKNAPKLKVVFYGSGSIKAFMTEAFWKRNIIISSAYAANAVPVAEYTLSQILFCLKRGWHYAMQIKQLGKYPPREFVPGAFKTTVGIVSLGMIGRIVCKLLLPFDIKVIAYDPFIDKNTAIDLNVELCSLDEVFREADVVSLHTPWLKETENMITGKHFEAMKPYSSFINTSRGAVVNEEEMIDVFRRRMDICAVLDVTYPEPPIEGSELYKLSNIILTPHIAGAMDNECRRMGRYMVEELERYIEGNPLKWSITREKAILMA
jgi:phosphoglycerate dehydrogenase-like enzyme